MTEDTGRTAQEKPDILAAAQAAYVHQLDIQREMAPFRCEVKDFDTAACYLGGDEPQDDWCGHCRSRAPIYKQWKTANARWLYLKRRLLREWDRRIERPR